MVLCENSMFLTLPQLKWNHSMTLYASYGLFSKCSLFKKPMLPSVNCPPSWSTASCDLKRPNSLFIRVYLWSRTRTSSVVLNQSLLITIKHLFPSNNSTASSQDIPTYSPSRLAALRSDSTLSATKLAEPPNSLPCSLLSSRHWRV